MGQAFDIAEANGAADVAAVAALFRAYAASLPVDLAYQDFAGEVAHLPGCYAPPGGALLLARGADGKAMGCAGLRPLAAPGCAEMKRLFVHPSARGQGLGETLAGAIVEAAVHIGYAELRLDTLPSMTGAIALYRRMGFAETAPYYAPTPPGTLFLALRLPIRTAP